MVTPFSLLWSTKLSDWQRGLVVAVLTTPLTIIYDTVTATPLVFTFDWKKILGTAIAAGIAYVLKNFGTGIHGRILTNAPDVPKPLVVKGDIK
jgi:hypothetical protein